MGVPAAYESFPGRGLILCLHIVLSCCSWILNPLHHSGNYLCFSSLWNPGSSSLSCLTSPEFHFFFFSPTLANSLRLSLTPLFNSCRLVFLTSPSLLLMNWEKAVLGTSQLTYPQRAHLRCSHCDLVVRNPTSIHEDAGSIPGFAQWVKDPMLL